MDIFFFLQVSPVVELTSYFAYAKLPYTLWLPVVLIQLNHVLTEFVHSEIEAHYVATKSLKLFTKLYRKYNLL